MRKPFFYSIDIVGRCNLHCPSCPQGNDPHRLAKDFMTPERLDAILLKAKSEAVVYGVGLFNWGEPFTHPDLGKMIRTVNAHKLPCYLSTNLNSGKNLIDVMMAYPFSVRISCSGFTQAVYEQTHAGGDIERVKRNMVEMAYERRDNTSVHMLWHRYKHNQHEEALMRDYCESLEFQFIPVEAYHMPLETVLDIWDGEVPLPEMDKNLLTGLYEHAELCADRKMECRNQNFEITIDALGRVQLCCAVYDSTKYTLCDYLTTSLESIQAARFSHSTCDRCINRGGHVYASGHSHHSDGVARRAAKQIYRKIAPLIPNAIVRRFV